MSLYHDAVTILNNPSSTGGSFKSRIYNSRSTKASPAQIYALITETAKWDILLKDVIEKADILKLEPKLTPLLALFLVHDHLLSKNGIAAPANHPLRQAVERHRSRLKGEFIKARVRRGCASIEDLKTVVLREKKAAVGGKATAAVYPRWIRINTVRTTLQKQLEGAFSSYKRVDSLSGLVQDENQERLFIDPDIPDLVAVPPGVEFTSSPAYKNGEIILQDKASCIPAYLLAGDGHTGNLVDACAAPGNKTTHLAALLAKQGTSKKTSRILSMDASPTRSKTLQKMVAAAGAGDVVTVLPGQDFLALDPVADPRFENVTGLLLDPSCSGSGIIGRDDVPELLLPSIPEKNQNQNRNGKKRKREAAKTPESTKTTTTTAASTEENDTITTSPDRLVKLSNLQTRIVEHALSFPSAQRVTYSTCSIHVLENESVVQRVLASDVARRRGWKVLRREEQPEGLRGWRARGVRSDDSSDGNATPATGMEVDLGEEDLQGCLRCWPGDEEGVGGFFVVGFVRDGGADEGDADEEEDEWGGFSD